MSNLADLGRLPILSGKKVLPRHLIAAQIHQYSISSKNFF